MYTIVDGHVCNTRSDHDLKPKPSAVRSLNRIDISSLGLRSGFGPDGERNLDSTGTADLDPIRLDDPHTVRTCVPGLTSPSTLLKFRQPREGFGVNGCNNLVTPFQDGRISTPEYEFAWGSWYLSSFKYSIVSLPSYAVAFGSLVIARGNPHGQGNSPLAYRMT